MLETVVEITFATGKIASMPEGMATPPEWALQAARFASERWIKPFARLTPEVVRQDPRAVLAEVLGIWDAMVAYLGEILAEIPADDRRRPEFKAFREMTVLLTEKRFRSFLEKIGQRLDCELPKPTHAELIAHVKSRQRGLQNVFSPDGEVVGFKTLTCKAYYCVWFFWPRLVRLPKLRAQDLVSFFSDEVGMNFDIKLMETVYTAIGLARRAVIVELEAT